MLGILGGGAAKLSAVVGIALGMRVAALVAAFQTLAFLMIFSVIWLRKKRQSQQHEEHTQFIDSDDECGQGSEVASTRSLASSPFSLATVTGILVQQWLRF